MFDISVDEFVSRRSWPAGWVASASPLVVRWSLRAITTAVFGVATALGVNVGLAAPQHSPAVLLADDQVARSYP